MTEIELKLLLSGETAAEALRASPELARLAQGAGRRETLRSIYFDTPDGRLRASGIALRVRKTGGRWVQTVKRGPRDEGSGGLFALEETESAAPGGRIDLARLPDASVADAVARVQGDAPLAAVFETVIDRETWMLAVASGRVELALDVGEVAAGDRTAPLAEAEFELKDGAPDAVYEAARAVLDRGDWRFSEASKAARGHALAEGRPALRPVAPRRAANPTLRRGGTAEAAAAAVLSEALAQIDANAAVCLGSDVAEGPHQFRVGLRRLRAALGLFRDVVGGSAADALKARARDLARLAGTLRDLDVQIEEVLRPAVERGATDEAGAGPLLEALERRREAARTALRAALEGPETRRLLLDLSAFVSLRGWLAPADHGQTARLSEPVEATASRALERLWRKVRKAAEGFDGLSVEERHALRKALKTLRYGVEFLGPLFKAKRVKKFRKRLKALQDSFGALNDAAVAEALFTGPDAPCRDDPAAQRAVGRLLGALEAAAEAEWREARAGWDALKAETPFWR